MPTLTAATTTGPGLTQDFGTVQDRMVMTTTVAGNAAGLTVNLEGSLDGTTWRLLGTTQSTTGNAVAVYGAGSRYARANITALIPTAVGSTVSVTAVIASLGPN